MSNPNIDDINPTISLSTGQTVPLLLASIALEELAMAHMINSEAEAIQSFLGTLQGGLAVTPTFITLSNFLDLNASVENNFRNMIMKEMLLQFKFKNVLDLLQTTPSVPPLCTPTTSTFSNPLPINIPDQGPADIYPSPIAVAGLTGTIDKVTVTLNNVTHGAPGNLDILLVGPPGFGTPNVMIMSDAGGNTPIVNATLTFDDDAPTFVPTPIPPGGGTFRPTDLSPGTDNFPAPAPSGPYGFSLDSSFRDTDPNGMWNLFVVDDTAGNSGVIAGGWSLTITTKCP
ncbi:hypothetical protein ABE288_05530 [Bacillus salipaludis]|uniref:hypothetical protein n=1 Tax=Bacillus salipaludis TaxID=2547811 RepID=UPI003D1F478B